MIDPNTFLLLLANTLITGIFFYLKDIKNFTKETRQKIDSHCENIGIHVNPNQH